MSQYTSLTEVQTNLLFGAHDGRIAPDERPSDQNQRVEPSVHAGYSSKKPNGISSKTSLSRDCTVLTVAFKLKKDHAQPSERVTGRTTRGNRPMHTS